MSGELSTRSSPSFAASPSGADDARSAGESTPLRVETESSRSGGSTGVKLRRRWQRRREQLGQWRVGDTWALDTRARWVREWKPRLPAGLRGGPHGGPALPVRRVGERPAHVRLPRRLARRRGHRAPLHGGRPARVELRHAAPLGPRPRRRNGRGAGSRTRSRPRRTRTRRRSTPRPREACRRTRGPGKGCMALDFFVILPVMQVVVWVAAPAMSRAGSTTAVMTVLLVAFLLEYLPKIYHSVSFLRRTQDQSGHIFGTIWWGIVLNLMAYFVAAHAVGACWYLLGVQRATKCLKEQCSISGPPGCASGPLACPNPLYYGGTGAAASVVGDRLAWATNAKARSVCLVSGDKYQYGAYKWTVMLVANTSRLEKMLLPIFWGLMTLSTFGNLESTTEWLEIVFNIVTITGGLILVTMLIGNIKVFLNATTSKKQAMHTRLRSLEWWMKRKDLPQSYRHRVRQFERQCWAATRGVDECQIVRDLPEALRRDIKYHLCLDLVRQVPLFQHMDDLVLENMCDRVRSLIYPKGETIVREGDPVQRMVFIVRGHLQCRQELRNGATSSCMLGPGNFTGDELLSWCLRRPFVGRLPASSATLVTLESTEVFGLEAADVKYVTRHFRYTFTNERVRRSARYYSPGWRTWAAVAVQLAWRRYKHRKTLESLSFIRPRRPLSRCSSLGEEKLRHYTAILASPKPNQDDDFSF